MAVVSVNKVNHGGSADGNKRYYSQEYIVVTDDPTDDAQIVRTATGIPQNGQFYILSGGSLDWSYVKDVQAELKSPQSSRLVWSVRVSFVPVEQGQEEEELDPLNPFASPPKISYSNSSYQEAAKRGWFMNDVLGLGFSPAIDGAFQDPMNPATQPVPIVNAAGELPRTPLMRDVPVLICTIEMNERNYSPGIAMDAYGAINGYPWLGADAFCVKCTGYTTTGKERTTENVEYWPVVYSFALNPNTWLDWMQNVGFKHLVDQFSTESIDIYGKDDHREQNVEQWLWPNGLLVDKENYEYSEYVNYRVYATNRPLDFDMIFPTITINL